MIRGFVELTRSAAPRWGDRVTVCGFAITGLLVDLNETEDGETMTVAFPSGSEQEVPADLVERA